MISPDKRMEIVDGDITHQRVDAIVNAANHSLLGGGGVDGAIHRAAGPELLAECRTLHGCPTGMAKITRGHKLPAKYVIHTVGPVWHGGESHEDQLLESCYQNSLQLALQYEIRTLAFPSISTGVYGFPIERASRIALKTSKAFLEKDASVERILFVCFGSHDYQVYQRAAKEIWQERQPEKNNDVRDS
jgi:O-acetyl-ADP-ribose deacetylase